MALPLVGTYTGGFMMAKMKAQPTPIDDAADAPAEDDAPTLTREGPAIMLIRLTDDAQKKSYIQFDSETGNQWQRDMVIETVLTKFVGSRLGNTLQEATPAEMRAYQKSKK